jgi:hypothetical protein
LSAADNIAIAQDVGEVGFGATRHVGPDLATSGLVGPRAMLADAAIKHHFQRESAAQRPSIDQGRDWT